MNNIEELCASSESEDDGKDGVKFNEKYSAINENKKSEYMSTKDLKMTLKKMERKDNTDIRF